MKFNPNRYLKIGLYDGKQYVVGVEHKSLGEKLKTDVKRGSKVLIEGPVPIFQGMLKLEPQHVSVLGGYVSELENERQKLIELCNVDPGPGSRRVWTLESFYREALNELISLRRQNQEPQQNKMTSICRNNGSATESGGNEREREDQERFQLQHISGRTSPIPQAPPSPAPGGVAGISTAERDPCCHSNDEHIRSDGAKPHYNVLIAPQNQSTASLHDGSISFGSGQCKTLPLHAAQSVSIHPEYKVQYDANIAFVEPEQNAQASTVATTCLKPSFSRDNKPSSARVTADSTPTYDAKFNYIGAKQTTKAREEGVENGVIDLVADDRQTSSDTPTRSSSFEELLPKLEQKVGCEVSKASVDRIYDVHTADEGRNQSPPVETPRVSGSNSLAKGKLNRSDDGKESLFAVDISQRPTLHRLNDSVAESIEDSSQELECSVSRRTSSVSFRRISTPMTTSGKKRTSPQDDGSSESKSNKRAATKASPTVVRSNVARPVKKRVLFGLQADPPLKEASKDFDGQDEGSSGLRIERTVACNGRSDATNVCEPTSRDNKEGETLPSSKASKTAIPARSAGIGAVSHISESYLNCNDISNLIRPVQQLEDIRSKFAANAAVLSKQGVGERMRERDRLRQHRDQSIDEEPYDDFCLYQSPPSLQLKPISSRMGAGCGRWVDGSIGPEPFTYLKFLNTRLRTSRESEYPLKGRFVCSIFTRSSTTTTRGIDFVKDASTGVVTKGVLRLIVEDGSAMCEVELSQPLLLDCIRNSFVSDSSDRCRSSDAFSPSDLPNSLAEFHSGLVRRSEGRSTPERQALRQLSKWLAEFYGIMEINVNKKGDIPIVISMDKEHQLSEEELQTLRSRTNVHDRRLLAT